MRSLCLTFVFAAFSINVQAASVTYSDSLSITDIRYKDNTQQYFYYEIAPVFNPTSAAMSLTATLDAGVGDHNLSPWLGWVANPPASTDWYDIVAKLGSYYQYTSTPGASLSRAFTLGANQTQWLIVSSYYYENQSSHHVGDYALTLSGANLPSLAAVPEPETYALMLAGLGLLSLKLRRKPSFYTV